MRTHRSSKIPKGLTRAQAQAVQLYAEKLAQELPSFQVTGVRVHKRNLLTVRLEWCDKRAETYREGLRASELAVEVADKTGVHLVLSPI